MIFEDGMAMPFVKYSDFRAGGYDNKDSEIQRFCVYVETDNDTDNDGMADLVKVFMQVPTAAVNGDYKAAVLYDPEPYNAGTTSFTSAATDMLAAYEDTTFDYDILYKECDKREPAGEVSTIKHAREQDPEEWNKVPKGSEAENTYSNEGTYYDYFLCRGFAIAECGGIGTYGSEGFELCGRDLERDSHKAVVEWLAGNRKAYTNKTDNIEVVADWSNKHVAMTGTSYGGTLPYEVATTGVEGLETIIPVAGIASWYEYTNSQGIFVRYPADYTGGLALYNSGANYEDEFWTVINDDYAAYLTQVSRDEEEANGDYTDIWEASDYSRDYKNIKCSALIVHGVNDRNVGTKQSDLMYMAFKNAGKNVKLLLHQDAHIGMFKRFVNDELSDEIVNKWLSHYLYGVENGIEDMPEVTAQSNITGKFETYDSWRDFDYETVKTEGEEDSVITIDTKKFNDYAYDFYPKDAVSGQLYLNIPEGGSAAYKLDLEQGSTIKGVPVVNVNLSTDDVDYDALMVTACLVDVPDDGKPFKAYVTNSDLGDRLTGKFIGTYEIGEGHEEANIQETVQSLTPSNLITIGYTDLNNPDKGYYSDEYREKTDLEADKEYSYHIYLNPTVYTVQEGHSVYLVILSWDPYQKLYGNEYEGDITEVVPGNDYSFDVYSESIDVQMPLAN